LIKRQACASFFLWDFKRDMRNFTFERIVKFSGEEDENAKLFRLSV
jgi:hypothetical protein